MKFKLEMKNLINPRNAVIFIPVSLGLIITLLYSIFVTKYTLQDKNEKKLKLNESERMKREIPLLKLKKDKLDYLLNQESKKKLFLIELVGGSSDLSTLLASLNNIANNNSLEILEIEPKEIIVKDKYIPQNSVQNNQFNGRTPTNSNIKSTNDELLSKNQKRNSLLTPDLEEHKINLKIQGNYIEIVEFLRDLELLENISVASNMQMQRLSSNFLDNNNARLSINISIYSKRNEYLLNSQ